MTPRQARRERREAERKAKKLELKKSRLAENNPPAAGQPSCAGSTLQDGSVEPAQQQRSTSHGSCLDEHYPEIQARRNRELDAEFPRVGDEFSREVQIRQNALADRIAPKAGLPIPPPGPTPGSSIESRREHSLARRKAAANSDPSPKTNENEPAPPSEAKTYGEHFVSQSTPSRAEINRANARHSTGPCSSEGELASSRNSTKHGLASGQVIIPGEDRSAFEAFLNDLLAEHQPATETEHLLVKDMAQSHWLTQRALRLQDQCFTADGVNEKHLALFLRYQTTHERAFYKALNTLLKLKKIGFVSQRSPKPIANAGFVSQKATGHTSQNEFVRQNAPATDHQTGFVSQEAPGGPAEARCAAKTSCAA